MHVRFEIQNCTKIFQYYKIRKKVYDKCPISETELEIIQDGEGEFT